MSHFRFRLVCVYVFMMASNEESTDETSKINKVLPLVVRTFFSEIVSDNGDIIEAKCSLCKPKKNVICGQHKACMCVA